MSVLTQVIRDALRQCRRRPLALLLAVAVHGLSLALSSVLTGAGVALQQVAQLVVAVVVFLFDIFLVPYLAGGVQDGASGIRGAWRSVRRSIGPVLRGMLLLVGYLMLAMFVATLIAGPPAQPSPAAMRRLLLGSTPLIAFATAFLVVLVQRIVLDDERKALVAAAYSHRLARLFFPICLLIGLLEAIPVVLLSITLSTAAAIALTVVLGLLGVWTTAMANGLYLRTRAELVAEEQQQRSA